MKKMILMSALALCVGSLVGMEKPEPQTIRELYDAILSNTNTIGFFTDNVGLMVQLEDAREEFMLLRGISSRTQANLLIEQLKSAIESIADPKKNPNAKLTTYTGKELSKALLYLQKLKELIDANPSLYPRQ